jgi:hypothetical protein
MREIDIEHLLIPHQAAILQLLKGRNTPFLQCIRAISPDPVVSLKKGIVFLINVCQFECICIMCASRMTEGIIDDKQVMRHDTVTCKTVTMFGTFSVYNLWRLYAWESHFMLVRDIGEPTPGYTWTPWSRDLAQGK